MDAFRSLDQSPSVLSFDVIDHRIWHTGSYLRLRIILRDGSELHTREYVDEADRKYSFHWQATDGELIIRWDNAPHHPELSTHPDHKHIGETVEMAGEVSLDEVLSRIEERIGVEE
jgi:hypothetical protein